MDYSVLVVDDDRDFIEVMRQRLADYGFRHVYSEDDPLRAAGLFDNGNGFDLALIDMTMPEMDGMALLERIKQSSPRTECIMVTAVNDARVAMACLRQGAYDYLVKPVSQEDLVIALNRVLERKRLMDLLDLGKSDRLPSLRNPDAFASIVTRSPKVLRILKEAELHAGSDVPILITGASGTGKELLARAIHAASPRVDQAFTPVNMASLTASLFEAEFFGHTKGAFTGAEKERSGYLKHSDGGTLFLDEIGNLAPELQGKLLRVLQDGEYSRLGTSRRERVDVRFIAATNEDLQQLMARKAFRKDLYYRIRGGWLHLPLLKDRREDIPLLIDYFLHQYCGERSHDCRPDETTLCLLMAHDYPGNIRELKGTMQSAVNLAQGHCITEQCLPGAMRRQASVARCTPPLEENGHTRLADVEASHILKVYTHTGQNKSRTARLLEIGLNTLRRKLKVYGIE